MTQAGKLRHRVTIEALTVTRNEANGAQGESWSDVADIWAEIVPLSGREFVAAAALQDDVSTRITIRRIEGIEPTMRVRHGETRYRILAVLPDPTLERHLTLMCSTGSLGP